MAARTLNHVELLKKEGPSSREELNVVRDPATNVDHTKVEKIFVELFMRVGEKALRDCAEEREVRGLKRWQLFCNVLFNL